MKQKRNLSGIYFRYKDPETGKWGNICFEDMTESEREEQMKNRPIDWHKRMIHALANTINDIGEHFEIIKP